MVACIVFFSGRVNNVEVLPTDFSREFIQPKICFTIVFVMAHSPRDSVERKEFQEREEGTNAKKKEQAKQGKQTEEQKKTRKRKETEKNRKQRKEERLRRESRTWNLIDMQQDLFFDSLKIKALTYHQSSFLLLKEKNHMGFNLYLFRCFSRNKWKWHDLNAAPSIWTETFMKFSTSDRPSMVWKGPPFTKPKVRRTLGRGNAHKGKPARTGRRHPK